MIYITIFAIVAIVGVITEKKYPNSYAPALTMLLVGAILIVLFFNYGEPLVVFLENIGIK